MDFFFQGTLKIAHAKPRTCVEMDPLGLNQKQCSSEIGNVTLYNHCMHSKTIVETYERKIIG